MRLGVLVSGRGSNLEALLAAGIPVALVISNRAGVRALDVAARHRVRSLVFSASAFPDSGARDGGIGMALASADVDLAILAGYDQLLRAPYFAAFGGRTINIHPSLLPAHGGAGMVGLAVHRSVLAAGDTETGASIHEVTADLDAGLVIARAPVAVLPGDDPETLAARVLKAEHRLLVDTVSAMAVEGMVGVRRASMLGGASSGASPTQERPITLHGHDS
jgi:phosphoribosylglycinamide formyltransferase-1